MKNLAPYLEEIYFPTNAILIYQNNSEKGNDYYLEVFDILNNGRPANGRPLSEKEANDLGIMLQISNRQQKNHLQPTSLLPENILHLDYKKGEVVWYTPASKRRLLFTEELEIPDGNACIPAMVWKADLQTLHVYALKEKERPTEKTKLFLAPFFNIYDDGKLCTGTIDIDFSDVHSLEDFIQTWEGYFFNSYFSHALNNERVSKENLLTIWKTLIETGKQFPMKQLVSSNKTLKEFIQ